MPPPLPTPLCAPVLILPPAFACDLKVRGGRLELRHAGASAAGAAAGLARDRVRLGAAAFGACVAELAVDEYYGERALLLPDQHHKVPCAAWLSPRGTPPPPLPPAFFFFPFSLYSLSPAFFAIVAQFLFV